MSSWHFISFKISFPLLCNILLSSLYNLILSIFDCILILLSSCFFLFKIYCLSSVSFNWFDNILSKFSFSFSYLAYFSLRILFIFFTKLSAFSLAWSLSMKDYGFVEMLLFLFSSYSISWLIIINYYSN